MEVLDGRSLHDLGSRLGRPGERCALNRIQAARRRAGGFNGEPALRYTKIPTWPVTERRGELRKRRVNGCDLAWMITYAMKESGFRSFACAVVSDEELGWRAVVPHRNRDPAAARKLASIEKALRATTSLAEA